MVYKGSCPKCGSKDIYGSGCGTWDGQINLDGSIETTDLRTNEIEWTCNVCGESGFDVEEEY